MGEWTFEKDDFLTPAPYEALYKFHKEPFVHATKMAELASYADSVKFKGFKAMYKRYVESLKVSKNMISLYERGEKAPSVEALVNLADFFGVSTDYLLGRKNF